MRTGGALSWLSSLSVYESPKPTKRFTFSRPGAAPGWWRSCTVWSHWLSQRQEGQLRPHSPTGSDVPACSNPRAGFVGEAEPRPPETSTPRRPSLTLCLCMRQVPRPKTGSSPKSPSGCSGGYPLRTHWKTRHDSWPRFAIRTKIPAIPDLDLDDDVAATGHLEEITEPHPERLIEPVEIIKPGGFVAMRSPARWWRRG
jgi:hypothetical protein